MASALSTFVGRFSRVMPRPAVRRSGLFYALWTAGWFLAFLLLTFPHELIVRGWTDRAVADTGWRLRFGEVWLRPWNGYHLSDVRVVAPGADDEPWFAAQELVVRPSWLVLLGQGPFPLHVSGRAYGGDFEGSFDGVSALDLEWSSIRLSGYPRLSRVVEGVWSGDLSGELRLGGKGDFRSLEGRGTLALKNASLTQGKAQGFVVPDLHFADGAAEFEFRNGRMEIRSLTLSGSEIDAELRGQLFLLRAGAMPVVSGNLSLKPVPGSPPGLDALLAMLNHNQRPPSGTYSFTLYGPLNAMRLR